MSWTAEAEFDSWRLKHPVNWSPDDVLNWVYGELLDVEVNMAEVRGESFRGLNGSQLCMQSMDEFIQRENRHGELLYRRLHHRMQTNGNCR